MFSTILELMMLSGVVMAVGAKFGLVDFKKNFNVGKTSVKLEFSKKNPYKVSVS